MQSILTYLLPGILGILLQIFAVKLPAVKSRAIAANHPFSFAAYLKDDWIVLVGNFIAVFILIVCLDELIILSPKIQNYIKWLFVFVGFTGSSIFMFAFSVADKKIRKVIDVKTNIADQVEPPVNSGNVAGMRAIKKEGIEKDAN